jgi:hypothetical protein
MAQMSVDLAKSILAGAGITKGEIDQLCHHYIKVHEGAVALSDGALDDIFDAAAQHSYHIHTDDKVAIARAIAVAVAAA